jgi:chromosome segregation protein
MIKSLKLKGFKSFADETEIRFTQGINCIVGPNGCGKSNVVDALKWVVGGTSAKGMRADSVRDLIFKGAEGRRPAKSAEVSVVVSADDLFSLSTLEAEVKRRITADGDSQFFINGKKVRLKDIQELFTKLGLSNRDYAFFEQGQIDRVLRMKPVERRALIDEAAGITPFKEKREQTLKELEEAQANLESVRGVIDEVAKNLRSLKSQAEKAKKFQELRRKEKELELSLVGYQLAQVRKEKAQLEGSVKVFQEDRAALEREVYRIEAEIEELRRQEQQITKEIEETTAELHEVEKSKREASVKKEFLTKEIERLKAELEERRYELELKTKRLSHLASAVKELQEKEEKLLKELGEFEKREKEKRAVLAELQRKLKEIEEKELSVNRRLSGLAAQETKLQTDLAREEERFKSFNSFLERFPKELNALEKEESYYRSLLEKSREKLKKLQEEKERLLASLEERKRERDELLERIDELESLLQEKRNSLLKLLTQVENTKKILNSLNLEKLERKIVESGKAGKVKGFEGLLINFLKVKRGYEKVVESYLSRFGAGIVVKDLDSALWIGSKIKGNGRVYLLVKELPPSPQEKVEGAVPLTELVEPKSREYAPLLSNLFHGVYYAGERAKELARKYPHYTFIDSKLNLISGKGTLVGNFKESSLLELEAEVKEKEEKAKELESEVKELQAKLSPLKEELGYLEDSLDELKERLKELELELYKGESAVKEAERKLRETEQRKRELLARKEKAQESVRSFENRKRLFGEKLSELKREHQKLLEELESLKGERERLQKALEELREELTELQTERATLLEKLKGLKEKKSSKEGALKALRREIEEEEKRIEKLKADLEKAKESRRKALELLEGVDETIEEIRQELQKLEERRSELFRILKEKEQALKQKSSDLAEVTKALKEAEIKLAKLTVKEEELIKKVLELDSSVSEALALAQSVENFEEKKRELVNLKERISRLGAVNLLAIEEYEKIKERYGFILEQEKDLIESIKNLKEAVKRLDEEIEKRFFSTFRQVDRHFRNTVKKVFGGGSGRLILSSQDLSEAGLEIEVKPPGKRHGSINLLSGGEKTLVALSFLYALYKVRPAPFVVLDEVDAALDDANTLRFVELLKEMANETQVIIITHNKLTMEAADTIYGVTMEVPGVSKVIGVSFEQLTV